MIFHIQKESFMLRILKNTKRIDCNTSLALFIQKLVGTASNWFEVQDVLVKSNLDLLLETFKNEF